jgi:hypothetical protein
VTTTGVDRFAPARAVADAVLYEGYVVYPYRASSRKNQVRWQFGVLMPAGFSRVDPSERSSMRTECLARAYDNAVVRIRLRGLHLQRRTVEAAGPSPGAFLPVERLEVGGAVYVRWDEAAEVQIDLPELRVAAVGREGFNHDFCLEAATEDEVVKAADGAVLGRLVRRREEVRGRVLVRAEPGAYTKLIVTVENTTPWNELDAGRDDALPHALLAAHLMLSVEGGRFVSLLDPPSSASRAAAGCRSDGSYPVLIGADDVVLSAPIILYDHPEVAPESPGDLYDATEIDEILALRVLTLTDEEKAEARGTDARAAAVIDRCDNLPPEIWERLHGAFRSVEPTGLGATPWWDPGTDASVDPSTDYVVVAGIEVRKGTAVRLRPSRRADAQDLFLKDRTAVVAAVFRDVDDNEYVAVTLDDDLAAAELAWQGRYLYFYPDELELL